VKFGNTPSRAEAFLAAQKAIWRLQQAKPDPAQERQSRRQRKKNDMKNLTVTIDRVARSNRQEAKAAIEEVLKVLQPLRRDRGLRVRVTRSPSTLREDKAWK
jgi:hypothetical protein